MRNQLNVDESDSDKASTRRVFILNGHPASKSLSGYLASVYLNAATRAGHQVKLMNIRDMDFDPDFGFGGYRETKPLEPDLEAFLYNLEWADHFVMLTPMWWGGVPAKLKGLFDRSLLPGRAFDTRNKKGGFPAPMLKGRSSRVILTSDTFDWYFKWVYHRALWIQLKHQILGFIGLGPNKLTHFAAASHPIEKQVRKWENTVGKLAAKAC